MKEIDKIFKDKLQSHEAVPPSALWDRLEDHLAENDKRKAAIWWRTASSAAAVGTLAIGIWWFASQQNEVGNANMAALSSIAKDTVVVNLPENQGNAIESVKENETTPTPRKPAKVQPMRLKQQLVPQVPEHLAERKNTKNSPPQPIQNPTEKMLAVASPDTANNWDSVATNSKTENLVAELKTPQVAPLPTDGEIVVELRPEKVQIASAEKPQTRLGRLWQKVRGIKLGEEQEALGEKIDEQRQRLVALIQK
ncbi:hypothetical protein SAMN05421780_101176 [Flexibacter flexilis DSM 6793]|uniref:Uncharacterized protein n=1 Tax=Flexibacter flexilis DSM 6793 TaxID=927664 RepID=A0A1I1DEV7_9BACT|nr:hypothetical protein [Flexibacter flexilis]SFB73529.1 hypothetical protein SAMN05421780_101176 [Flexibacter flexilis DSM 6793]